MANEARIRLSVDTASAQKDVKIIDKQLRELGGDSTQVNIGKGFEDSVKTLVASQQKLIDSISKYTESTEKNTKAILSRLESIKSSVNRSLKDDAENVYQNKLRDLETRKRMMETGLNLPATSSGGGGNTNYPGSSPYLPGFPSSNPSSSRGLSDMIGKLGLAAAALGAIRSTWNFISSGAKSSVSSELQTYQTYNTSGYYDNDFSKGRNSIASNGAKYGYTVGETLNVQDALMSMMGASSVEKTQADSNAVLGTARALGIDEGSLASSAGKAYQKGTYDAGDMSKFTNFFAASVKASKMTGREDEQLEVLQSIQELLGKNLTTISENQMTSSMGLYAMLANTDENLRGSAGSSAVSSINEGITKGDSKMDMLLGWGTQYKGVEGKWALEVAKEQGISNPENLQNVFSNFEKFTGQSIDSDAGKLALKNLFGVDTATIEALVSNKDAIKNGTIPDELQSVIDSEEGKKTTDKELDDYYKDTLSTTLQYQAETANAQERMGDHLNDISSFTRGIYNKMPDGGKSAVSTFGAAVKGAAPFVMGAGLIKGLGNLFGKGGTGTGFGSFFSNLFGGGSKAAGAAGAKGAASATDDIIDVAWREVADDVVGGSADDVMDATWKSVDDVAAGASKSGGILSKVGKIAKVAPYLFRGAEGIYDYATADTDEEKGKAVGSTAGGMGGIWAGGGGGAALGTAIFPGVGTIIGGILGAIGGDAAGSWAGGELGESAVENWKDAETNYGTGLASLPLIGGLWKKDGTLIQQQIEKEQQDAAKSSGGLPSDFGMPEIFDTTLNDNGSDINWSGLKAPLTSENSYYRKQMENKYGMNADELDEWVKSDEYKNWQEATGGNGWTSRNVDLKNNTTSQEELRKSIDDLNETIQNSEENGAKAGVATEGKAEHFISPKGDGTYITAPSSDTVTSDSTESAKKSSGGLWSKIKNLFGFGSNAIGKDYIPYDGYISELHKGEAILSADEADAWRTTSLRNAMKPEISESVNVPNYSQFSDNHSVLEIKLSGSVDGMTEMNQSEIVRAVVTAIQNANGTTAIMNMLGNNTVRLQN